MTFDPSKTTEHTVPEVVDAVTEHPGLAADVLAAERARTDREPRATLIEKIEALQAAGSAQAAENGDPAPAVVSGVETANPAGSGDGDGSEQIGEATGVQREGIDVASGETATLTGDGTPRDDDGAAQSRITPDVPDVNMTQESVMAGEPMTDTNRGSAPVTTSSEQPGAVIAE